MVRFVLAVTTLLLIPSCSAGPPLPSHGSVPSWSLQSSTGEQVELEDLLGQVTIYDFIFTRCAATCPMMTAKMQKLVRELRSDDFRFASISVDPEWDTPAVLREYREKVTTDERWIFLTGPRDLIRDLSVEGFMLAAELPAGDTAGGPIVHSSRLVLVDRDGVIRGYYDALSSEAMKGLEKDARRLLREG